MQAGDIVVCTSKGLIGASIRWAQKRSGEKDWDKNHVAVLNEQVGNDWTVIQADAAGVTDNELLSTIAPGGSYSIINLPSTIDRGRFLTFLRTQVGSKYGYLSIVSCSFDMWLPDAICLRRADTWICSGLVAGALWFCGFPAAADWHDLYTVTPAEITAALSK